MGPQVLQPQPESESTAQSSASPSREISCTVMTLTKSITLSPPRKRATPAGGQHVVWARIRNLRPPAPNSRRRKIEPALTMPGSFSRVVVRCSGAIRFVQSIAWSRRMQPAGPRHAFAATAGRSDFLAPAPPPTAKPNAASFRDCVISSTKASGSCSACATRSAAMNDGSPSSQRIRPFRRARQQIDGAIESHHFLGGGHEQISRPDDLVHPRNALCAVGQRRNRLRAADAVELASRPASPPPPALPAPGGAKPRECPSLLRPAPESPSSARLRAAG